MLDHINYGSSLDLGDWTAGDPGDPQTLQTNIGIISDNAVAEYKTLDVTQHVRDDIANERTFSQFRMRFTIDTDNDSLGDFLLMVSGNALFSPKPYLAVVYDTTITDINNHKSLMQKFVLEQNHPNPFNPVTTIAYYIPQRGLAKLIIFDVLGNKVQTLVNAVRMPGSYSINFDASHLASGIYYYRLQLEQHYIAKKMLLIR